MRTILADAAHISEFATDPQTRIWLTGTCGETAAIVAEGIAKGFIATVADMTALYDDMKARGLITNVNGASTMTEISAELRHVGCTITEEHDYEDDSFPGVDWITLLRKYAAYKPIVLQLANAQALTDVATGQHDENGVKYHYICIVGRQDGLNGEGPAGYICADGDNPGVEDHFQIYTYGTLAAALPCAMLIIEPAPAPTPVATGGPPVSTTTTTLPGGWSDSNGVLTTPKGYHITEGFRAWLLSNPSYMLEMGDLATAPYDVESVGMDANNGSGTELIGTYSALCYQRNTNQIRKLWIGVMLVVVKAQLASAQSQLADANGMIAKLQAQANEDAATIAKLQTDLATAQKDLEDAKNAPAPTPDAQTQRCIDAGKAVIELQSLFMVPASK